ncbi:MAG: class I SAM-dependent methyltransferase [Bacteroidetes bacterium]|nr:class I SAM-dependent methyltransferase [Bacteroidota bacterium]
MVLNFLLEKNIIPDSLICWKIRQLLQQRLYEENKGSAEANKKYLLELIDELKNSPIAVETNSANEQHYEVPTEFYKLVLGKHLKYSSCYYKEGVSDLNTAECDMLELTCERAELKDGMEILELGCGWGSLSLFIAEKFPKSNITSVSNSRTQKIYIDNEAKKRNISNLTIITADMNHFSGDKKFDRVISVEMFEHMRNYHELMKRISNWLKEDGKLFVHIFTHKKSAYKFEIKDESDWMSKYFFTGGIMPNNDLLFYFDEHLVKENFWIVNGTHYSKTSEAWLKNMDSNKKEIISIFGNTYGKENALKWFVYWRIFFMACAELWGFNNGNEWMVCHYLFRKK